MISEELQEAKEAILKYKNMYESEKHIHELRNRQLAEYEKTITAHQKEKIELNLQLLKKDKIIDEMAEALVKVPEDWDDPQAAAMAVAINKKLELMKIQVKEYFKAKVENEIQEEK